MAVIDILATNARIKEVFHSEWMNTNGMNGIHAGTLVH
jgi:hypothetical protein